MIIKIFLYLIGGVVLLHTAIRIIRRFYKFPMPQWMANAIDNPLRRRIQPPGELPARHGIRPGAQVLEIGPGNGHYTLAAAEYTGQDGKVTTLDIEPKMIKRVKNRLRSTPARNIDPLVGNAHDLPFPQDSFDAVYMITVIGEIPNPGKAFNEFFRVLRMGGTLAFSEILFDPDYTLASTLQREALQSGFRMKSILGNFFSYSIVFEKV